MQIKLFPQIMLIFLCHLSLTLPVLLGYQPVQPYSPSFCKQLPAFSYNVRIKGERQMTLNANFLDRSLQRICR